MNTICRRIAPTLLAVAILVVVSACEQTRTPVALDGTLAVFSNDPAHPVIGRASDWVRMGADAALTHKVVYTENVPGLEVTGAQGNAAMLRRTEALLLATPFLFWSWSAVDGPPEHPVRLVIGLADKPDRDRPSALATAFSGPALPAFSRTLTLIWGASALQRGSLDVQPAAPKRKPRARYVVRGGRENRNRWWSENLDLSQIHVMAWPQIDMADSRVVFVGISVAGGEAPGKMLISGLRLSR